MAEAKLKEDFGLFQRILQKAHPSLNAYLTEKRALFLFDSVFSTIKASTTLRDFYNKISFITNEIGCSHTYISLAGFQYDTLLNRALFFPLPLILINNKVLVNADEILPHGTELLTVNNRPVDQILDMLMMYNPVEGKHRETQKILACKDFGLQHFMRFGGSENYTISMIDTSGIKKDTILNAVSLSTLRYNESMRYYYDATNVPFSLKIDDEYNYGLIRLTDFGFESANQQDAFENFLKNTFELLRKKPDCNNLIIDLRENNGGFLYSCFLFYSYLTAETISEFKSARARIGKIPFEDYLSGSFSENQISVTNRMLSGDFRKAGPYNYIYYDSLILKWNPQENRYRGKVYIIVNEEVMSAASYFTFLIKNTGRGTVVGIETKGGTHSGNGFTTLTYDLPGTSFELGFSFANILYTNSTRKTGSGVLPDYIVPDTFTSFSENKDRQLLYIIDSLILKSN